MVRELRGDNVQITFPENATYEQALGPAMEITDQQEADRWFEGLVEHYMRPGRTQEEAEPVVRQNLSYYAGYYDNETRERVERLFHCSHPVLGSIAEKGPPTLKEVFEMGVKMGQEMRRNRT